MTPANRKYRFNRYIYRGVPLFNHNFNEVSRDSTTNSKRYPTFKSGSNNSSYGIQKCSFGFPF